MVLVGRGGRGGKVKNESKNVDDIESIERVYRYRIYMPWHIPRRTGPWRWVLAIWVSEGEWRRWVLENEPEVAFTEQPSAWDIAAPPTLNDYVRGPTGDRTLFGLHVLYLSRVVHPSIVYPGIVWDLIGLIYYTWKLHTREEYHSVHVVT